MDADQSAFCNRVWLGEHNQRSCQFGHVIYTLHTIPVKQGLVGVIAAGNGARMGHGKPRRELGAADFDYHHGNSLVAGFPERCNHPLGIARSLHEQSNYPGFGLLQRVIHILIHGHAEFLAGGNRQVEIDPLLTVNDAGHT